jgi:hypothetical protein
MEHAQEAALWLGVPVDIWGTWVAGLLTLAIFSFLYADNPIYKAAEHLFVGVSAAYGIVVYYFDYIIPKMVQPLLQPQAVELDHPKYILLIPIGLGLLILTRYVRKIDYLARWPIAVSMAAGAGMSIPLTVQGVFLKQMEGTMRPIWPVGDVGGLDAFNNFLVLVGVVCTLSYFYFSLEHKGALGVMSRIGIWFLMVAFGAGFGNTVGGRISLLIGRVQFLIYDFWPTLHLPPFGPHPGG